MFAVWGLSHFGGVNAGEADVDFLSVAGRDHGVAVADFVPFAAVGLAFFAVKFGVMRFATGGEGKEGDAADEEDGVFVEMVVVDGKKRRQAAL